MFVIKWQLVYKELLDTHDSVSVEVTVHLCRLPSGGHLPGSCGCFSYTPFHMEPLTRVCPGYVTRVRPAFRSYFCLFYHLICNRLVPLIDQDGIRSAFPRVHLCIVLVATKALASRQKALFEEDGKTQNGHSFWQR